jgi:predicted Holliday junction resolvase-like endonuclease
MAHLAAVLNTVNLLSLLLYLIQLTLFHDTVQVKKRRQERELERQHREEEMALMQRSKEAAQFQEWERQEDQFHLEQARLRSCIRIQDGRGVNTLVHSLKCYAGLMFYLFLYDIRRSII